MANVKFINKIVLTVTKLERLNEIYQSENLTLDLFDFNKQNLVDFFCFKGTLSIFKFF